MPLGAMETFDRVAAAGPKPSLTRPRQIVSPMSYRSSSRNAMFSG